MIFLDCWWEINLLLCLSYFLFVIISKLFFPKNELRPMLLLWPILIFSISLPIILRLIPMGVLHPPVQVRSVEQALDKMTSLAPLKTAIKSSVTSPENETLIATTINVEDLLVLGAFILGLLIWPLIYLRDFYKLKLIIKKGIILKKYPQMTLVVTDKLLVPCSFWRPFKRYVFLPHYLIGKPQQMIMALAHELQHHRNGDTVVVYFLEILRSLFFINPFIHLWIKKIAEYQEMNCDQKVLARNSFPIKSYGHCLLNVADHSKNSRGIPLGIKAMASYKSTLITRRIHMLYAKKHSKKRGLVNGKILLSFVLMGFALFEIAHAAKNFGERIPLTYQQGEELYLLAKEKSKIPIDYNPTVFKWLDYFTNDPKGRAYVLLTRDRMRKYEILLSTILSEHQMPLDLLAVPFMESGYQNNTISSQRARGLWQFIPSTARKYGLRVNRYQDERTNEKKATVAAIKYYRHLLGVESFENDWRLALLAYNTGESALQMAMIKEGTKDPWAFNDLGDKDYLAKIMAGIILLKNPQFALMNHPLPNGRISSRFGIRRSIFKGRVHHDGIDFAAEKGTAIFAPLNGIVKNVTDRYKGSSKYGKVVTIMHEGGIETRYFHLDDMLVSPGEKVVENQPIAKVGSTGVSTGPHLHFEVRIAEKAFDPELFLANKKVM